MPRFSIVIPTYLNSPRACLESLKQYTDIGEDCEVVLVCNGAPPETKDIPAQLGIPATIIWFDEPQGFSHAVNIGITESHGELVVLLNDDCTLLPQEKNHWLDLLAGPFDDPQVGITGSHKLWDPDTQHDFIIFFCAMLRRTMVEQIGGLDESLSPFYGEDITMCIEAERAGWKWVQVPVGEECRLVEVPNSDHLPEWKRQRWVGNFPISHDSETTLGQLSNHVEVVERNRAKLRQKYGPVNIERAKQIEGWMSESELHYLATEAKTHPVCVEIGAWLGRSSRAIADNLPEGGRLYCVDTWDGTGDDPAFAFAKEYGGNGAFIRFYKNLWDYIDAGRVIPLRMSSLAASKMMRQLRIPVNMIFVDGAHGYESVKADLMNWRPLLTADGLLCGHDYTPDWPGVAQAVDSLLVAEQVPNTGIWRALDRPLLSPSFGEYGGLFA